MGGVNKKYKEKRREGDEIGFERRKKNVVKNGLYM